MWGARWGGGGVTTVGGGDIVGGESLFPLGKVLDCQPLVFLLQSRVSPILALEFEAPPVHCVIFCRVGLQKKFSRTTDISIPLCVLSNCTSPTEESMVTVFAAAVHTAWL